MRILRVITSVDRTMGGPIEGIRQITPVLDSMGHVTEIVSLDDPAAVHLHGETLSVHALGPSVSSYAYSSKLLPWLSNYAQNYDIVIVHGLWQYISYCTRNALHKSSVPYYVYTHGMLDPWFNRTYPLKHIKKLMYWPWADYRVLRDARSVLFTSDEERILARQSFSPYRCNEVVVNYGTAKPIHDDEAVKAEFFAMHPDLHGKRIFLYLSRIHPKKGCDNLIDAFAQVAQTDDALHLVVAGPDKVGMRATLEEQARSLGIENRITWPGMLTGNMKWGAYEAAEAFILPSHQENFGIVVAEALACGCPVLISNKVNIWREIEADGAGFVENDDLHGTVSLFKRWLGLSAADKAKMAQSGRETFLRRFEISQAALSLINTVSQ